MLRDAQGSGCGNLSFASLLKALKYAEIGNAVTNSMKRASILFVLCSLLPSMLWGKDYTFSGSLDKAIDWSNPLALNVESLAELYKQEGFEKSPIFSLSDDKTEAHFGSHPYSNITIHCTLFEGKVEVDDAHITFSGGNVASIVIDTPAGGSEIKPMTDSLSGVLKASPTTRSDGTSVWKLEKFSVFMLATSKGSAHVSILPSGVEPEAMIERTGGAYKLTADLDFVLDFDKLWQMGVEDLEKRFVAKGFDKNPYFEWLNSDKSRARFSMKPASNVTVALKLFQGKVPADEAIINFTAGKVSSVQVSLYNRGDSGDISLTDFETRWKTAGAGFGSRLKIQPRALTPTAGAAVKILGFRWDAPNCIAMLEYNQYGKGTKSTQPEFLRVRMASPKSADWSMGVKSIGQSTTTVSRASLIKNVTKSENGDVYIAGVPMVDQGQKGYCVVASCQRLFEYYHIPCDQHEIAQLAQSDASGGTNSRLYEEALNKIDSKFQTRFKSLFSRYSQDRRTQMNEVKFAKEVKSAVDAGLPLLWALDLGLFPEEPPLPGTNGLGAGQSLGGHMRMIIGYNEKAGKVLYTDSWGAGHELKRMNMNDGFRAMHGLYMLLPKAL
jgi:Peptidase_C39 like family